MTKQKIISIKNLSFSEVVNTVLFTVPVGQTFTPQKFIFKGNDNENIAGSGEFSIVRKSDDLVLVGGYSDAALVDPDYTNTIDVDEPAPIMAAGEQIELRITVADPGNESEPFDPMFDLDIVGFVTAEVLPETEKAYTDIESVRIYLGVDEFTEEVEEKMPEWIAAMTNACDNMSNRVLYTDVVSSILYDGDGSDLLHIKDCCDIEFVKVGGVEREFYGYPTTKPYNSRIVMHEGYYFTKGRQNVEVRAVQAMSSVLLPEVKQACTVLVAGIYNARNVQGKVGTTERIGNYSVTYRDEAQQTDFEAAKKTLSGYRRIALG